MAPNPTALVLVALALLLLVVAFKGTQDNFMSALLGRPWSSTEHLGSSSPSSASGTGTNAVYTSPYPHSATQPLVPGIPVEQA